jgi:hypothetical protein
MGGLFDFERGQIVGAHLAGASVTKTDTILGVSRALHCNVNSANNDLWEELSLKYFSLGLYIETGKSV